MDWSVIADRVDRLEPSADLWSEALRRVEAVPSRREPAPRPPSPLRRLVWVGVAVILLGTGGLLTAHALSVDGSRPSAATAPAKTGPRGGDAATQPPLPIGRDPFPLRDSRSVHSVAELLVHVDFTPQLPDGPLANRRLFSIGWVADRNGYDDFAVFYRSGVLVIEYTRGGALDFTGLARFTRRIDGRRALVFPADRQIDYPATVQMMVGRHLLVVAGHLPVPQLVSVARTLRPVE